MFKWYDLLRLTYHKMQVNYNNNGTKVRVVGPGLKLNSSICSSSSCYQHMAGAETVKAK